MRKAILLVSLSLAASALAVRIDVPSGAALETVDSRRKAQVLRDARAAFTLGDGSQWITHAAPVVPEPGAIAVTRFGPGGSAHVFCVSDWLPKGSIPAGWCGQVYGVPLLDDGRVAVSAGWTDGQNSHNGIFVLRALPDGRYAADKRIEVPGVAQIAGAPRNTILAVTTDATRPGGGPLLTLFDTEGLKLPLLFSHDIRMPAPEAARNAVKAHLRRIDGGSFALYDPFVESVIVFELEVGKKEAVVTGNRIIFIGDDAATADLPVLGIDASEDGDILVVRVKHPWFLMLREKGRIRGVVLRNDVGLDSVHLRREK
jgi:hypothetical protein